MGGGASVTACKAEQGSGLHGLHKRQYPKHIRHLHQQHRRHSKEQAATEINVIKADANAPGLPPLANAALRSGGPKALAADALPNPSALFKMRNVIIEDDQSTDASGSRRISEVSAASSSLQVTELRD